MTADPMTDIRDRADVLSVALAMWDGPGPATDQATARRADGTAIDAIDDLPALSTPRRLTGEIRASDYAAAARVDGAVAGSTNKRRDGLMEIYFKVLSR